MMLRAFAVASVVFGSAGADQITPNWGKLTDFTTSVAVDMDPYIEYRDMQAKAEDKKNREEGCTGYPCGPPPPVLKSIRASGKVQLDLAKERFKMDAIGSFEYGEFPKHAPPVVQALSGAKGSGHGLMAFDVAAGFVVMKEKGLMTTKVGDFAYGYCVKVHFPQGLLPPGQVFLNQLDKQKASLTQMLNGMPHKKVVVDGNTVDMFEKVAPFECLEYDYSKWTGGGPPPPCKKFGTTKLNPDQYAAVMSDGTPVGYGITPPAHGTWNDAIVKFSGWTQGAGTIEDEACVSTSATELLQSHHANRSLMLFDQVVRHMKSQEPLSSVLAFIPAQPSEFLSSAAKLENLKTTTAQFSEQVQVSAASSWATLVVAAAGGIVGASFVLWISRSRRAVTRARELLG